MDKKFSNNKLFRRNLIMFYECITSGLILDKIDNIRFGLKIWWLFLKNLNELSYFLNLNTKIQGQLNIFSSVKNNTIL